MTEDNKARGHEYANHSRGYKTKGNEYKDRYVNDVTCPQCGHNKAYKDTWKTRIAFSCMKRSCRYKWFEKIVREEESEEVAE